MHRHAGMMMLPMYHIGKNFATIYCQYLLTKALRYCFTWTVQKLKWLLCPDWL